MPTNRRRTPRQKAIPPFWEYYCERFANGYSLIATPGTDEEAWERYGALFIREYGRQGNFYERFGDPA